MMTVVLDPALHSMGGHHHSAYLRLGQELTERAVEHRYLVSNRANDGLRVDAHVRATFSRCVYGRTNWTHLQFSDDVDTTLFELRKGMGGTAQHAGAFILPCADQVLTLALARYLGSVDRQWAPQVLIWLLYGPHWKRGLRDPETGRVAYEYQGALSALASAMRSPTDLTLVCETSALASYYSAMAGIKVGVMPGPGLRLEAAIRSQGSVPTILCIGHANAAKGYGLLARAISGVLRKGLDVRFVVHGSTHDSDDPRAVGTMEELMGLASTTSAVSVSTEILTAEDYQRWMSQADMVLMPYDPAVYGVSRGSGVLSDAERLGVPAIAPRRCGFAESGIAEGRIAPIERYDSCGVADAIVDAVARLASLTARARAVALQRKDRLGEMIDFHLTRAARPHQREIMQRVIGISGQI